MPKMTPEEQRVLIFAGRDAAAAERALRRAGFACRRCASAGELMAELRRGAGVIVLAEARLRPVPPELEAWMAQQPAWSDLPALVLAEARRRGAAADPAVLRALPRVTVLRRPFAEADLAGAARNMMRSRMRQYAARAMMTRVRADGARANFALHAACFGAFTLRLSDFVLETNALCRDILGHEGADAITYEDLAATVPRADGPRVWDIVQSGLQGHEAFSVEYHAQLPGRRRRWLQITGQAFIEGGVPREVTCIVMNITEQKQAALALAQSEIEFRAIFEQAAVGIAEVALDGRFLRVNDRLCAILGRRRDELLATDFQALTHAEDLADDLAQVRALIAGEIESYCLEKRYLSGAGGLIWARLTVGAMRDAGGRALSFISVIEDITDRKTAEARLAESEARLRMSQEAAGIGTWDWNIAAGARHWSDTQYRLLGLDPGEHPVPEAETWLATVHPEDRARVAAEAEAALAQGTLFESEHRLLLPGGELRQVLWRGNVQRDAAGRAVRMLGVTLDVTRQRALEAQLRQLTRELEAEVMREVAARERAQAQLAEASKLEALGQLAGGIAHDFNNVLQGVTGGLALIEKRAEDPAMVRRLARMSAAAAERGASVTGRLLSFARRGTLKGAPVPVTDLLEGLREILAHALGSQYAITLAAAPGLWLRADRGQLETVLVNLVLNARDALPRGGAIRLEAAAVAPRAAAAPGLAAGEYVRLRVIDDGIGMEPATLARAAEPFFTTKAAGEGTGLGLAMAQGFARQSGGAFAIESAPGRGTAVTIWLPRTEAPEGIDPAPPGAAQVAPGWRVLVVDDDAIVREVVAGVLSSAGYEVAQAPDGLAALALIEQGAEPHMLVTDLTMPGMSGDTLIAEARARRPGLPALLLTGYAERRLRENERQSGPGITVLTKPVTAPVLLHALEALRGGAVPPDEVVAAV